MRLQKGAPNQRVTGAQGTRGGHLFECYQIFNFDLNQERSNTQIGLIKSLKAKNGVLRLIKTKQKKEKKTLLLKLLKTPELVSRRCSL